MKVLVLLENVPGDLTVSGAQRKELFGTRVDIYEAGIDLRAPALHVIDFTIGYSAGDIVLKTIPLVVFLILPSLWRRRAALPEKNVFLQWQKESDPEKETLHFVAVGERSIWLARRAIDSLQQRLESWRNKLGDFPSTQAGLESIVGPSFPEIASAPTTTSFRPVAVLAAAFQLACYALLVSFAFRLTALGMFYVAAAVFRGYAARRTSQNLK